LTTHKKVDDDINTSELFLLLKKTFIFFLVLVTQRRIEEGDPHSLTFMQCQSWAQAREPKMGGKANCLLQPRRDQKQKQFLNFEGFSSAKRQVTTRKLNTGVWSA
jgi:hypothetical protein